MSEREQLLGSIGRLFEQPTVVPNTSILGPFLDEAIQSWDESQGQGWLVDPKENRTALAFQFLTSDQDKVQAISLGQLANKVREASNVADAETNGLPTFDDYRGLSSPSVILRNDVEGYETKAVMDSETYLFAPVVWRAMVDGIGAEVRPFHEDTDWVRGAVNQRRSRKWEVGAHLSPSFQASRVFGFVSFVRNFARAYPDAQRVRFVADYRGLAGRTIDDTRPGAYFRRDRSSITDGRRVEIESTMEKLAGDGAYEVYVLLLNPILRLFDGLEINAETVPRSLKDF